MSDQPTVACAPHGTPVDDHTRGVAVLADARGYRLLVVVALGIVLAVGVAALVPGMAAADGDFDGGDGTEDDPYQIANWTQLDDVREDLRANYTLVTDLDESTDGYGGDGTDGVVVDADGNPVGGDGFEPIGESDSDTDVAFVGTFNGSDFTISNLTVDRDDNYVGLFGATGDGATIEKVGLEAVNITGDDFVGGLVGQNGDDGDVSESYATGDVTGGSRVGGLVGENFANMSESYASGDVTGGSRVGGLVGSSQIGSDVSESYASGDVTGGVFVGGLVGENFADVSESYATGTVRGDSRVGGLVGENSRTVTESYATGTVRGDSRVGGLVGNSEFGSDVHESYATGTVRGDTEVGGLVGSNEFGSDVHESYATGNVSGDERVGGMVGSNSDTSEVYESYASGDVTGDTEVGGLVGTNRNTVTESYATGNVTGDAHVGGLVGDNDDGEVSESYWDDQAATITEDGDEVFSHSDGGEALRTVQMTGEYAEDTMFAFGDTWDVVDNPDNGNEISYPFLQDTAQDPEPGLQNRYASGDGDAEPYELTDWAELAHVRMNLDANFTLMADLDESTDGYDSVANETANDGNGFDPIGKRSDRFTGTFNGSGFTISNVTIDRGDEKAVGLFGVTGGDATIEQIGLEYVDIHGDERVGGLVGVNDGGDVSESYTTGNVTGNFDVGGLVGFNDASVSESYATSTVSGEDSNVGGLVGTSVDDVRESYATGDVTGTENVSGLVGTNSGGGIEASFATGNATGEHNVGGLVGAQIHASGTPAQLNNSYATGDVSITENQPVGGLVGTNQESHISQSFAAGLVDDRQNSTTSGGLVGQFDTSGLDTVFWDVRTTNQSSAIGGGTGTETNVTGFGEIDDQGPTAELQGLNASKETQLAFRKNAEDGIWHVTDSYPALAWEDTDPFFAVDITETNAPIEEGETLDVTASLTNWAADGELAVELFDFDSDTQDSETIHLGSGTDATETLSWATAPGDVGSGAVTVDSATDTASESVTVEAISDPGSSSPTRSSTQSSISSDVETSRTGGAESTTDGTPRSDNGISSSTVDFRASAGSTTTLNFSRDETNNSAGVSLRRLAIQTSDDAAGSLSIREGSNVSEVSTTGAGPLERATDSQAIHYMNVETGFGAAISSATIEVVVSSDTIGDPEDATVYHADGNWCAVETDVIDTTDDSYTIAASTDGFSTFAVGTSVSDAEHNEAIDSASRETDEQATESALSETDDDDDTGFGLFVPLGALVGMALLVAHRRRSSLSFGAVGYRLP